MGGHFTIIADSRLGDLSCRGQGNSPRRGGGPPNDAFMAAAANARGPCCTQGQPLAWGPFGGYIWQRPALQNADSPLEAVGRRQREWVRVHGHHLVI